MATWRDWDKIRIAGATYASNFSSVDRTDSHCVEYCPEQLCEPGQALASFGHDYDPENADLPSYIKCLRAFSYSTQEYPFLDGDELPCDDYPDDDGRFDAYA